MHNKIKLSCLTKGQLLFRSSNNIEISNVALNKVANFDHVGLLVDKSTVIEATPRYGVRLTKITDFLEEGNVYVANTSLDDRKLSEKAADIAKSFLGAPYNNTFEDSTKKGFYCSQLVAKSFEIANNNVPYFKESTLNFKDSNGKISDFWTKYFSAYNLPVPQDRNGSHPTKLFFDKNLKHRYKLDLSKSLQKEL